MIGRQELADKLTNLLMKEAFGNKKLGEDESFDLVYKTYNKKFYDTLEFYDIL
jgi:hypothetical protein